MAAQIRSRDHAGMLILELSGALRASPASHTLVPLAEEALRAKPAGGIVLNVSALESVDSAGLGELVRLYMMAEKLKLRLAMTGASKRILTVLQTARLDAFYPQYEDEPAAINGLLAQR